MASLPPAVGEGEGGTSVSVGITGRVGGGVNVYVAVGGMGVNVGGIGVSVGGMGVLVAVGEGGANTWHPDTNIIIEHINTLDKNLFNEACIEFSLIFFNSPFYYHNGN